MNNRVAYIDELRGIAVIIMLFFHFIYQENLWNGIMGELLENFYVNLLKLLAQIIFIAIAGVCCNYSRDNIKRGLIYIYIGLFIDLLTYLIIPGERVVFGIFSFLGISILIYEIIKVKFEKISLYKGIIFFIIVFILMYFLQSKFVFKALNKFEFFETIIENGYLNFMGIKSSSFKSSDFFPIFPWIFIFMAGALWGRELNKKKRFRKVKLRLLAFIGERSLFIYIIHIPIIIFIIKIIS